LQSKHAPRHNHHCGLPRYPAMAPFVPESGLVVLSVVFGLAATAWTVSAETSSDSCDLGIVGAGAGGAYAAWRAAVAGRSVCVFEMRGKPGGRIHSMRNQGPKGDLVVEAGGYRFAPHPVYTKMNNFTERIDTPLTAAIMKELKIPTAIYNPNPKEWDHGMHKVVDAHGEDAGYLTFIERMLDIAIAHGAKVRYNIRIVGLGVLEGPAKTISVRLADGGEVFVKSVLFNIPQRPLIELLRNSAAPIAAIFPRPLYDQVSFPIMKLYVHYDDAWWRNDLGLTSGQFLNSEPRSNQSSIVHGVPNAYPAPLQGAYHDGHVRCDGVEGRCRGFLQAYYGGDTAHVPGGIDGAMKFYSVFADSVSNDAANTITPTNPVHAELLSIVHSSLVDMHRPALDAQKATKRVSEMKPTGAVLSIWDQGVAGINAGCHTPKLLKSGAAPGANTAAAASLEPLPGWPMIFVANEAFGSMQCFAEGSLAMAEAAMRKMNVSLPPSGWLDDETASQLLSPATCNGRVKTDPALLVRASVTEFWQQDLPKTTVV